MEAVYRTIISFKTGQVLLVMAEEIMFPKCHQSLSFFFLPFNVFEDHKHLQKCLYDLIGGFFIQAFSLFPLLPAS